MVDDNAPPPPDKPARRRAKAPPRRPATTSAGTPTACTPELIAAIGREVEQGVPLKYAAGIVGIAHSTLRAWMTRGECGEEPFAALVAEHTRARSSAIADAVKGWRKGVLQSGMPDWKAKRELAAVLDPDLAPTSTVNVKAQAEALDVLLERLETRARPQLDARAWEIVRSALAGDEGPGEVGDEPAVH